MNTIITLVVLVLSILVFFLVDGLASTSHDFKGVIVDKHYKAEHSSTGVGVGAKGEAVVTTQHESEKFILMVKRAGKVHTVTTTAEKYYQHSIGDQVKCKEWKGLITKQTWDYTL
jgi:hypothetical protein